MQERRRHRRQAVNFPVTIDAELKKGRIGMVENTSVSGMLLGTQSRFEPGQELCLRFRLRVDDPSETAVHGRVVRTFVDDGRDMFRRLVAVQFHRVTPALAPQY